MKTIETKVVGYSEDFIKSVKRGWGCGYVLIPLEHPFLVKALLNDDSYFYPQIDNFSEEITYCEYEGDYLRIGFDTAHSWNSNKQDELWVQQKTNELKDCIDNYTILNAKLEVQKHFIDLRTKFKDYL